MIIKKFVLVSLIFSALLMGCFSGNKTVILATTTSVENSGILDELIPLFERDTGYKVKVISVGSGQAIMMGRRGEADILLAHSEKDEESFMKDGFGIERKPMMYNDFLLVGPYDDPAGIKNSADILSAFRKIAHKETLFISRGDNSGTHLKELEVWKHLNIDVSKKRWYHETGLGMGETLNIADEKNGYALTDRATYLTLKKNLKLIPLFEDRKNLKNPYHIIIVNPDKFKKMNYEGARALTNFFISEDVKKIIRNFRQGQYQEPLFIPF
ncbi:MAG: substrate-binding domain-containing protein [Proteobacteria bacterium]|nr:substrate-binding domain-containing protein [Pseudomonadota bacterium]